MGFERYSFYNRLSIPKSLLFGFAGLFTMLPTIALSFAGMIVIAILMLFEYRNRGKAGRALNA
jgi:hypothetical protein